MHQNMITNEKHKVRLVLTEVVPEKHKHSALLH